MEVVWILYGGEIYYCNDIITVVIYRAFSVLLSDYKMRDIKTESAAAVVTAPGSITSVERLEEMRKIFLIDMRTGITYLADDSIRILEDSYRYLGVLGRIEDCIAYKST